MQDIMAENFDLGDALIENEKRVAKQRAELDAAIKKIVPISVLAQQKDRTAPKTAKRTQDIFDLVNTGLFRLYADFTKPFSEAPLVFHIGTLMHTISSIIGRSFWIQQGVDRIYPNLFTLLVAPSSLFKKSSAEKICSRFLSRLEMLKDRWLGKIGSPEGLFSGLEKNGGLGCLHYPEFGGLLAHSKAKYMEGVLDRYSKRTLRLPGPFLKSAGRKNTES